VISGLPTISARVIPQQTRVMSAMAYRRSPPFRALCRLPEGGVFPDVPHTPVDALTRLEDLSSVAGARASWHSSSELAAHEAAAVKDVLAAQERAIRTIKAAPLDFSLPNR